MNDRREHGFPVASFETKATADNESTGEFEALISVFGNVDLGGDRVVKGAFAKSLAKWRESGDPIPVVWNHQWDDPFAHIGKIDPNEAEETDEGLLVKGVLDVDKPLARQVHDLMRERRVKEFSFGYKVVDAVKAKDGTVDLLELDLFEGGPTLKGMNPDTQLLAVKAYADTAVEVVEPDAAPDSPAGLSKDARAALEQARDLLDTLLSVGDLPAVETNPIEAEAVSGKASDADLELITRINVLKET